MYMNCYFTHKVGKRLKSLMKEHQAAITKILEKTHLFSEIKIKLVIFAEVVWGKADMIS